MVVDIGGGCGFGGDQNGLHAHGMRGGKIAGVILKHCGGGGVQAIKRKDRLERRAVWFGVKTCIFNPVDGIEHAIKPTRLDDLLRVGGRAVGVDDPPARQRTDMGGKRGVGDQSIKVDVMHIGEVRRGVNPMFAHQARQSGAVRGPVVPSQAVRLGAVDVQGGHYPIGHPYLDLIEQAGRGGIKRVIKVKDPLFNMRKIGADVGKVGDVHLGRVLRQAGDGNGLLLIRGGLRG